MFWRTSREVAIFISNDWHLHKTRRAIKIALIPRRIFGFIYASVPSSFHASYVVNKIQ